MKLTVAFDREVDGRWICELRWPGGVTHSYGDTKAKAKDAALAVALDALADDLREGRRRAPKDIALRVSA
jgi:hypothetical protein